MSRIFSFSLTLLSSVSLEVLFAPERMAILSGSPFRLQEPLQTDRSADVELPFYNIMLKVPPLNNPQDTSRSGPARHSSAAQF